MSMFLACTGMLPYSSTATAVELLQALQPVRMPDCVSIQSCENEWMFGALAIIVSVSPCSLRADRQGE